MRDGLGGGDTPKRTLWQRLWSSPWTWLGFWVVSVTLFTASHGWPEWAWLAGSLFYSAMFFSCGNERWGRP